MTTISNPTDGILTGGQPTETQLEQLADDGVTAVINLRAAPELETLDFDEANVVEAAGMTYVWLPVAGPGDLTEELVRKVDDVLANNARVLIHCASSNRVGGVLALREGWLGGKGVEDAVALGKAAGLSSLEPHVARMLGS